MMNVQAILVLAISLDDFSKDSSAFISSKDTYFQPSDYWNQHLHQLR